MRINLTSVEIKFRGSTRRFRPEPDRSPSTSSRLSVSLRSHNRCVTESEAANKPTLPFSPTIDWPPNKYSGLIEQSPKTPTP